jgi:hypothetical protein
LLPGKDALIAKAALVANTRKDDTSAGTDFDTLLDTCTDWNSSPMLDVSDTPSATTSTNDLICSEDDGVDNDIEDGSTADH